MNSHYFGQYLLNKKIITSAEAEKVLEYSLSVNPQIPLLAVVQGMVTAEKLNDYYKLTKSEFIEKSTLEGILTNAQIGALLQMNTGESMAFAQATLELGILDLVELSKHFEQYKKEESSVISEAIDILAPADLENEKALYGNYAEVFMRSLIRFLNTPALIDVNVPVIDGDCVKTHIVSQALVGDTELVAGIYAPDEVFLELACRYSQESLEKIDDLAKDSILEFINVMNGLFAVELANRQIEVDLDLPRLAANSEPFGNQQLTVRIDMGFGSFLLVMAGDEFIIS